MTERPKGALGVTAGKKGKGCDVGSDLRWGSLGTEVEEGALGPHVRGTSRGPGLAEEAEEIPESGFFCVFEHHMQILAADRDQRWEPKRGLGRRCRREIGSR